MASIQDFMTEEEKGDYAAAASLAAAGEPDRKAWVAAVVAQLRAEDRAIAAFEGEVRLNRNGQPYGGRHPAISCLDGYMRIAGCYAPD